MFRTKFKSLRHDHNGIEYWVVIYKKWYQLSWYMVSVNNDPYRFDNKDAADYMAKCLEEAGL